MNEITHAILTSPELGLSAIFLGLFLLVFYMQRKDAQAHKEEYKEVAMHMLKVCENNTHSNTKLCESIKNLNLRIG